VIEKFLCIDYSTALDKLLSHSVQRWDLWWHDVNTKFYICLPFHPDITGLDGGVLYFAYHDQIKSLWVIYQTFGFSTGL